MSVIELRQTLLEKAIVRARTNFSAFHSLMAPLVIPGGEFVPGRHIDQICSKLEKIAHQNGLRYILEIPPGGMKSLSASVLFPAWLFGNNPTLQFLQVSHSDELAGKWGRKTRDLLDTNEYKIIFPETKVSETSYAGSRWDTTKGGTYFAAGATKQIAGFRGNVICADDLLSEQTARSDTERTAVLDNWHGGIVSRLLPGGSIIICNTRWHVMDLAGKVLKEAEEIEDADQWERLTYTALADEQTAERVGVSIGTSYWPEYWPTRTFEKIKAVSAQRDWQSLYMQSPIIEGGNIIKAKWVKDWEEKRPPPIDYCLISVDSAFSTRDTADYTAITIWGIFNKGMEDSVGRMHFVPNMILLGGKQERMDFPELCSYLRMLNKKRKPDTFLIEKKASGESIIQELRRQGIPCTAWLPDRDKVSRVWACQPIFEAGRVWMKRDLRFSQEVIKNLEEFPNGEHDDLTDSVTQAVLWMRRSRIDVFDLAEDAPPKRKVVGSYWKRPGKAKERTILL